MLNKDLLGKILSLDISDRNNFILDLAEQKNQDIYEIIIYLIEHEKKNSGNIGTLIYALRNYPAEPLFLRAVHWILYGGFEVSHEGFEIINKITRINGREVEDAYKLIMQEISRDMEEWRRLLLSEVLDMFV